MVQWSLVRWFIVLDLLPVCCPRQLTSTLVTRTWASRHVLREPVSTVTTANPQTTTGVVPMWEFMAEQPPLPPQERPAAIAAVALKIPPFWPADLLSGLRRWRPSFSIREWRSNRPVLTTSLLHLPQKCLRKSETWSYSCCAICSNLWATLARCLTVLLSVSCPSNVSYPWSAWSYLHRLPPCLFPSWPRWQIGFLRWRPPCGHVCDWSQW